LVKELFMNFNHITSPGSPFRYIFIALLFVVLFVVLVLIYHYIIKKMAISCPQKQ